MAGAGDRVMGFGCGTLIREGHPGRRVIESVVGSRYNGIASKNRGWRDAHGREWGADLTSGAASGAVVFISAVTTRTVVGPAGRVAPAGCAGWREMRARAARVAGGGRNPTFPRGLGAGERCRSSAARSVGQSPTATMGTVPIVDSMNRKCSRRCGSTSRRILVSTSSA